MSSVSRKKKRLRDIRDGWTPCNRCEHSLLCMASSPPRILICKGCGDVFVDNALMARRRAKTCPLRLKVEAALDERDWWFCWHDACRRKSEEHAARVFFPISTQHAFKAVTTTAVRKKTLPSGRVSKMVPRKALPRLRE